MYPHRIQLKGPWDFQLGNAWSADTRHEPRSQTIRLPCRFADVGLTGINDPVSLVRRFGRPREVSDYERLWITCAGADYLSHWYLNGDLLGSHIGAFDPFEFEVTSSLRSRNELRVLVECPDGTVLPSGEPVWRGALPPGGGLWGTVALEIRRESCLRDLCVWPWHGDSGIELRIGGMIHSEHPGPVELYVLLDGAPLSHQVIERRSGEVAFDVSCSTPSRAEPSSEHILREVKVELIQGAALLDSQMRMVTFEQRPVDCSPDFEIHDLAEPITEASTLDLAAMQGRRVWLRLPRTDRLTDAISRQVRAVVRGLIYHPAIAGWITCGHAGEAIAAMVREVDCTRAVIAGL